MKNFNSSASVDVYIQSSVAITVQCTLITVEITLFQFVIDINMIRNCDEYFFDMQL